MLKTFFLLLVATLAFAKYDNCTFKNKNYIDICEQVVKHGVSYEYANRFLLSYFKTKKYDEVSWKYLQPRFIPVHKHNEKKANNVLVKHVPKIVANIRKYEHVYDLAEKKYGVNREIIASILMKETKLGHIEPTHDAFIVFNTIVVRTKQPKTKREKWLLKMGKNNMAAIIEHCYKIGVEPIECNLKSSYAGAVGIPQFMPNSFHYIDGYKTDKPDLTKMEDAILSTAKFLNKKAGFTKLINWNKTGHLPKIETAWYTYAAKHENASFVYAKNRFDKPYKCFTCGKKELQYLREYTKKIMRYNNSSNYAVGVIRLAYDTHYLLNK